MDLRTRKALKWVWIIRAATSRRPLGDDNSRRVDSRDVVSGASVSSVVGGLGGGTGRRRTWWWGRGLGIGGGGGFGGFEEDERQGLGGEDRVVLMQEADGKAEFGGCSSSSRGRKRRRRRKQGKVWDGGGGSPWELTVRELQQIGNGDCLDLDLDSTRLTPRVRSSLEVRS
ncbi:hypothetical protein Dimus_034640 [Dionaea muscipula]